jgi:release factor glutamine methyltransferase
MMTLRPPGVYRPQTDTRLLTEILRSTRVRPRSRILDLGTGTGALAVAAAAVGHSRVTAVDISRRAVWAARMNAWLRGIRLRVLHGDLFDPVKGEEFDVILANPPYVPSPEHDPERAVRWHSPARSWDAGLQGRKVLDRICARAPRMLAPGGTMLIVHSALCDDRMTVRSLRAAGLTAEVVARRGEPFGRVMRSRAAWLEARELIFHGQRQEELVVIRAVRPADDPC